MLAFVIALIVLAGTAQAQGSNYVEVQVGAAFTSDLELGDVGFGDMSQDFNTGWSLNGAGGHDYGVFRDEVELFWESIGMGDADIDGVLVDVNGDVTAWGGMLNAFAGINDGGAIVPFVGAGAGYGDVTVDLDAVDGVPVDNADGRFSNGEFIWQLMAGAAIPLGASAPSITVEYRFQQINDFDTHQVLAGVRFPLGH